MKLKANVSLSGAILLGDSVACDGHENGRPIRVVTHAHYDHMLGLEKSLRICRKVVMTEATRDLIRVLKGKRISNFKSLTILGYEKELNLDSENLTFYYADHILGATQVLVEDSNGLRMLYTGDFRLPKTPVINADILVIEATYGSPAFRRPFKSIVESLFVSLVEKSLEHGPVYVFGYHGKLQEAMQILFEGGIWAPFILPKKVLEFSLVCEKHGMKLGDYIPKNCEEARELISKNDSYVAFYHMSSKRKIGLNAIRIYLTGWEFKEPIRKISNGEYVVALSDHADFDDLLSYVEECEPKIVITDNYRVGEAETLAREISRKLKIKAVAMPKKG